MVATGTRSTGQGTRAVKPRAVRVRELFVEALDVPAAEREHFLQRACCDHDLRLEVAELLTAIPSVDFLSPPELTAILPQLPATHFGPYQVERRLDDDAWLARAPSTGRIVRIETLPEPASGTSLAIAQFVRQAHGVQRLALPLVVRTHEHGVADGSVWIAMDHVEGPSLATELHLQAHPTLPGPRMLPPCAHAEWLPAIAALGAQLGGVLWAAHAMGLAHGELTADRIVLEAAGRPRLRGFGCAALRGKTPSAREDITALGALVERLRTLPPASSNAAMSGKLGLVTQRAASSGRGSYATIAALAHDLQQIAVPLDTTGRRGFGALRNWFGRRGSST
jgi:serine/threonine protein kinase